LLLTNLALNLLFSLKEGLISQLIIGSFRRAKNSEGIEVKKFLGKEVAMKKDKIRKIFPSATLEVTEIRKINAANRPHRWETIKKNHSDFDIYINDNIGQLTSTRKNKYWIDKINLAEHELPTNREYQIQALDNLIAVEELTKGMLQGKIKQLAQIVQQPPKSD
jgi:hypothetical protein